MREIRVKNLTPESLVHIVVAMKPKHSFLIEKTIYEKMLLQTTEVNDGLHFTTVYTNDIVIDTVVKFQPFCDMYYRLDSVTVNGTLLYGYSQWVGEREQIVIDAE